MIRVESEETQDHVRKEKSAEEEAMEEMTGPLCQVRLGSRLGCCFAMTSTEKSLSRWQLASVVVHEADEAYTTNLCQKCLNNFLQAKGEKPLSNVQWR